MWLKHALSSVQEKGKDLRQNLVKARDRGKQFADDILSRPPLAVILEAEANSLNVHCVEDVLTRWVQQRKDPAFREALLSVLEPLLLGLAASRDLRKLLDVREDPAAQDPLARQLLVLLDSLLWAPRSWWVPALALLAGGADEQVVRTVCAFVCSLKYATTFFQVPALTAVESEDLEGKTEQVCELVEQRRAFEQCFELRANLHSDGLSWTAAVANVLPVVQGAVTAQAAARDGALKHVDEVEVARAVAVQAVEEQLAAVAPDATLEQDLQAAQARRDELLAALKAETAKICALQELRTEQQQATTRLQKAQDDVAKDFAERARLAAASSTRAESSFESLCTLSALVEMAVAGVDAAEETERQRLKHAYEACVHMLEDRALDLEQAADREVQHCCCVVEEACAVIGRPRPDRAEAKDAVDGASKALAALDDLLPKIAHATGRNFPRLDDSRQRLASCVQLCSVWEPKAPKPYCRLESCSDARCLFEHRSVAPDPYPQAIECAQVPGVLAAEDSVEPPAGTSSMARSCEAERSELVGQDAACSANTSAAVPRDFQVAQVVE